MKILVLAALVAVVSSGPNSNQGLNENPELVPWQVGKQYRYDVDSYTFANFQEGSHSGSAFKAQFVIRVLSEGRLIAKLENPRHALVHQVLKNNVKLPEDLKYEIADKLETPFEIIVQGGRVVSLNLASNVPLAQENVLKGLVSALQVDLSSHRQVNTPYNGYNEQEQQGVIKKMETDVTGDCETLYDVHPSVPEWKSEIPMFSGAETPMLVSKTRNYGNCHHRVEYHFGVPIGWDGSSHVKHGQQVIQRATVSRMLVGKQGPIYKTETTSTVHVNPMLYGKEKAEVISNVKLYLVAWEQVSDSEWTMPENMRNINNLLYSVSHKQVTINERSHSNLEQFSKTIDGVDVDEYNQFRHYTNAPRVVTIKKTFGGHSDSDSSSSSDWMSAYVNDDMPNPNEPAYSALYMSAQARGDKKQNPINVQRVVQEMAQQLQNPNNMPKSDFLSKFNILVRVLASMTYEQLSLTSNSMISTKTSNNSVKADMWNIYRDGVTQVGNMPTFRLISSWVQNRVIQGEEAAEVVATLVHTIRYPTKEIMSQFFKLAVSEQVQQQEYLNSTALIAATTLINMAQVNNETAHSFYPVYMYGQFVRQHDSFVYEEVLPVLSQQLKQAIEVENIKKAQVVIKALGNLGHRGILDVFAPYLEGKIQVSTFLRRNMILNLDVLALTKDSFVRAVLFNILKNAVEPYEVRAAAIQTIFMSHPTRTIMQAMARMTHDDPSMQVRALIKTIIVSTASLKHHSQEMVRNARTALPLLSKQEFGTQYSSKYLNDYYDWENGVGVMSTLSYTGSKDSLYPKTFKYSGKSKSQGWHSHMENSVWASVSNVKDLYSAYVNQLKKLMHQQSKPEAEHMYSVEKISQMLGSIQKAKSPLAGALNINLMGQERFFAFDASDWKQMPSRLVNYLLSLDKGAEMHYTKVFNQEQISIMLPLCSGMPFIYKYKTPTVVSAHVKSKSQAHQVGEEATFTTSMENEIHLVYARNLDGSVGFMDTLVNQYAQVGVVSKVQVQLPVKIQMENKKEHFEFSVEPIHPDQDSTVVHFSIWPYSTIQKRDSLVSVSLDPNTKVITKTRKVVAVDTKFGHSVGHVLHLQGYSYSSDYNIGNSFKLNNILGSFGNLLYPRNIAMTHFNLRQLNKQSHNKRVSFTFSDQTYYNHKHNVQEGSVDQPLVASPVDDVTPNSKTRREEMAKRVSLNIKNAKIRIVDVSATIDGQQKQEFIVTAAIGNSPVNSKMQYAVFLGKNNAQNGNEQINAVGTVWKPSFTPLNFVEALKKDLKVKFEGDVLYGNNRHGNLQVYMVRSPQRTEELVQQQLARECAKHIESGNIYSYECYKMVIRAHAPDYIKAIVNYKDVSSVVKNMTYKAMRLIDYAGYWYSDVNLLKVVTDSKFEIESQFDYAANMVDMKITSKMGQINFNSVPIPRFSASALAVYPLFTPYERVMNDFTREQYQPFCTIDSNKIRTFSGRNYNYTVSPSWHVVIKDDASREGSMDKLVALAKRPVGNQMELYVSYKTKNGEDLELQVQPSSQGKPNINVKTDAKKVMEGERSLYVDKTTGFNFFEYFYLPDGVVIIKINKMRLHLVYDGQRVVVLVHDNRNNIEGLCGHLTGDIRDDYLTPYGLVNKPEHYGASYALIESNVDSITAELKNQAKQVAYPPRTGYSIILPYNEEYNTKVVSSQSKHENHNAYRTRSWVDHDVMCQVHEQVQYYENDREICITNIRLPACSSRCRGERYTVTAAEVICGSKLDKKFQEYKKQILGGQNPTVHGTPKEELGQFRVPTACKA
ncbi:hypothetical protein ACJJTC_007525 [Scirpophaga incertulas]